MNLTGRKVLVTGGAGFIGSHLVDTLIERGCFVRVIDNLTNGRMENLIPHKGSTSFEFMQGSIVNPSEVSSAVSGVDIIFHLACLGVRHSIREPFENHRVNAEGTLTVLREARKAGIEKFVYCSSSEVYGTAEYVPMPEAHPARPCTVYGASKLAGEAYTRAYHKTYGLNTVIVRPFNTYGPRSHHEGDAGELIPKSVVRVLNGRPVVIFGDGSQTRDYTYVEDMARGIVKSAETDALRGKTLNIGNNSELSANRIAAMILEINGSSPSMIEYLQPRPGDVLRLYADASVFRTLTGWSPQVSFEEGLRRTVEWFTLRPEGSSALLEQEVSENWK